MSKPQSNPNNSTSYEDNIMAIQKMTTYWHGRAQNAGLAVERDEVFSEVCLAFAKAQVNYKPSTGYRFSTFYYSSIRNELSKWTQKQMKAENYGKNIPMLGMSEANEEDGWSAEEYFPSEHNMESEIHLEEIVLNAHERLSKTAKIAIDWIVNPPSALERELEGGKKKAQFSTRKLGVKRIGKVDINLDMILSFLSRVTGMDEEMKKRVRREVLEFKREVSGYDA